jgi:hypothetical protein
VPAGDRTRDRGHGRVELRTLKAVSVTGFSFSHAAQVLQVTRKTPRPWHPRVADRDRVCDHQPAVPVGQPARLADLLRGHWAIEALHHLRDVTFCEDASQVRTGAAPHVMAVLRNLVIGVLSRAGPVNLAAALRRHARNPRRPLATWGSTSDETDITTERRSPAVVGDLLVGLRERGLEVTRPLLVVLDGAKALRRAVTEVFDHPVIQRCQLH